MAKTNKGLIDYCKQQVGKPYFYGTFGQKATKALYNAKKKQYPDYYTWAYKSDYTGQRVHDCAGLIKGYLWSETPDSPPKYNAKQDYGATAFYEHCTKKGTISSFDRVPGRLVFKANGKRMSHVGVWDGEKIIEAKGHAYGIIISSLDSKWTHWGQCNLIEEDTPAPEPIPTPTPEPTPAPTPAPASNEYKVKTNGSPLALRRAPNAKAALIVWMPNGSKVTVSGTNGSWSRTTYKGMTGWAFTKWLAKA